MSRELESTVCHQNHHHHCHQNLEFLGQPARDHPLQGAPIDLIGYCSIISPVAKPVPVRPTIEEILSLAREQRQAIEGIHLNLSFHTFFCNHEKLEGGKREKTSWSWLFLTLNIGRLCATRSSANGENRVSGIGWIMNNVQVQDSITAHTKLLKR